MSEVHFITAKVTKTGKLGNLPCDFSGTETFFFETDNDAITFANAIRGEDVQIVKSGSYRTGSVRAGMASFQVFYEGVDKICDADRFAAKVV